MENPSKLLTIVEAGCRLNVSRSTIYNLIKRGSLPLRKIGSKSLIAVNDVDAFTSSLPAVNGRSAMEEK